MGKKQDRKAAKRETNAVEELCRVRRKYVPELFDFFEETADPRDQSYITYTNRMMLGQMFFKGIAGIISMQGMTQAFNWVKFTFQSWCSTKPFDLKTTLLYNYKYIATYKLGGFKNEI